MFNWIDRLVKVFKKPDAETLAHQDLPTMVSMNSSSLFNYTYPEVDLETMILEDYDTLEGFDRNGEYGTFCVLGDLLYGDAEYLICINKNDLLLCLRGDPEHNHRMLVMQVFPGVNKNGSVLYPVLQDELHEEIYEAYMRDQENPEH
jgi:hypothetical protein